MRLFVVAAFLAIALSGAAHGQTSTLPPPRPPGVEQAIGIEETGGILEASVGKKFAVTLIGQPSTGSGWIVVQKPSTLSDPQRTSGPTVAPVPGRMMVGGKRWDVFTFDVLSTGEEVLRLERRSVQGAMLEVFDITVVVN